MSKILLRVVLLCLPALVLAQSPPTASRYQPATITQVKPHQSGDTPGPR